MGLLDSLFRPSHDKFARMFMAELKRLGDPREMKYDKAEFRLVFPGKGEPPSFCNLHNMYGEYCGAPRAARPQSIQRFAQAIAYRPEDEIPDDFDGAKPDLLPVVRTRSYLAFLELQVRLQGGKLAPHPFAEVGDYLVASLVYDLPHAMLTVTQEELDKWGVTVYEALEIARDNLQEKEFTFAGMGERVYASMTGDNYDASRLLMLDLIRKLKVRGDPVAMVPNRDTLLLTGSEDDDGLKLIADLAVKALGENPRPMYAIPVRLDQDEWVSWMPPKDHPLHGKYHDMKLRSLGGDYETQKELLDALHEKEGIDLFVADFSGLKPDGGGLLSYCVWGDGVDALLPETDKVAFVKHGNDAPAFGPWEKVREVVGHLMEPTDLFPPRWHVTEFPNQQQLEAIGNEWA